MNIQKKKILKNKVKNKKVLTMFILFNADSFEMLNIVKTKLEYFFFSSNIKNVTKQKLTNINKININSSRKSVG